MACVGHSQTPAPVQRREGHASADLFPEEKSILRTPFDKLEHMFMARCRKCRPWSIKSWTENKWTDNDRTPMNWSIGMQSRPAHLTPLMALEDHFVDTLQFTCKLCSTKCGEIELSNTPEKLYLDLRDFVCHDTSLPFRFLSDEANADMPDDAWRCCEMAHKFPADEYLTHQVLSRIEKSLIVGALQKVLHKKMLAAAKKHGDPYKSYIRIGVLFKPYGPITAVLELWPSRHSSPKHQHGGCAGSVRLMHGNLRMRLYETLQSETPMRIRGSNEDGTIEMQAPETTWLNRMQWFVHSVESPAQSDSVNPRGYALSLHVYKSCTDEFAFTVDNGGHKTPSSSAASSLRAPEKGNPDNDFVWVIPGFPTDDERAQDKPWFNDKVISSTSAAITDKKLFYIRAVERDPSNAKAWFDLAVYCEGGRVEGVSYNSKECCIRSLELDPADPMAWAHLAVYGGGSVNGARWPARKCFEHADEKDLGGRDDIEGFKRCYIRALELDPDNVMAWLGLGFCLSDGGDEKILGGGSYDAKTCLIRGVELDPDVSPIAWIMLFGLIGFGGEIIVIKGTSYDEKMCLIRALEVDPECSIAWNHLGEVGGGSVNGISHDKKACYHRALELDPEDPDAHDNLQELLAAGVAQ